MATKTKTTINIGSDDCTIITVTDISGFYDSVNNPTGFLQENSSPIAGSYKLTDGYFLDIVLYNKYGVAPTLVNTTENFVKITTVDPVYTNNFIPTVYKLPQDGSYSLIRLFLISDVFYNANKTSGLFTGKSIYYFDGDKIYRVNNGVSTSVTIYELVASDLTNVTGAATTTTFVFICYLNQCYYKLSMSLLPTALSCNTDIYDKVKSQRDFVFITLEVIKYLVGQPYPFQVQFFHSRNLV